MMSNTFFKYKYFFYTKNQIQITNTDNYLYDYNH